MQPNNNAWEVVQREVFFASGTSEAKENSEGRKRRQHLWRGREGYRWPAGLQQRMEAEEEQERELQCIKKRVSPSWIGSLRVSTKEEDSDCNGLVVIICYFIVIVYSSSFGRYKLRSQKVRHDKRNPARTSV